MGDATGRYNSVLLLGGTSDLGIATAQRLVEHGGRIRSDLATRLELL